MKDLLRILAATTLLLIVFFGLYYLLFANHAPTPTTNYQLVDLPPSHTEIASSPTSTQSTPSSTPTVATSSYLTITAGCTIVVDHTCYQAFSAPDASSTKRADLRVGTVLLIKDSVVGNDGEIWYEIDFAEALRYEDRLTLPWFVPSASGIIVDTYGPQDLATQTASTSSNKLLVVDRSEQKMFAYEDKTLVYTYTISTGRDLTPTPRGIFTVFRKTPTRYMQGPIPGINTTYYDLPGVPWNLYFTEQGAVVHGAYWHDDFGNQHSNGCVNLPPRDAKHVYDWADLGMTLIVQD